MYKFEYRAQILRKHLGVSYGEIASSLGITKKELQNWFRDKNNIPKEKIPVLADYFRLMESELFEEITLEVTYSFLSDLVNQISSTVKKYEEEGKVEDLIENLHRIQDSVKEVLIKKQEEMKIR